ncbi:chemotaxis protein CheW [Paraglaciecola sp.]|uniref:chemotaxis protein CheW n=1 Tax=Paraglaciecola sp. TaxID=1920173 RepID=UPI0030F38D1E
MSEAVLDELTDLQHQQYLTFVLRDESYGISITAVKEIIEYGSVTSIPLMPEFVKGVLNLRGEVVPVIDLSIRFGKTPTKIHNRSCIVILEVPFEHQQVVLGVVVDAVNEVLDIRPEDIEGAPTFGAKIRAQFIKGVANINEQFVILLHGDRVLSVEEMANIIESVIEQ